MKHLTKLILLAILVIFASCENESTEEQNLEQNQMLPQLRFENGNVVSDGEEDKSLLFNENSETLVGQNSIDFMSFVTTGPDTQDLQYLESMLPEQVSVTTTAKPGNDAYFNLSITDNSEFLTGAGIPAWCADQDLSLDNNETADFDVYSSYGELPEGKFEFPENFDKVNWLLNQTIIGEESPNGLGEYTFGHIQYAIWLLVDDSVCQLCTFLSDPTGDWNADGNDIAQAEEIRDLALANGDGFVPTFGELMAIILVPEGKQSVIITKEVIEEECDNCIGKVDNLTFNWDWHNDYRVRLYQRHENTYYATKIFDQVVGANENFTVNGANADGTFGKWIYVFVGHCYYTKFRTDCQLNIGPGYRRGVVEVVSGTSTDGGELCEFEPSHDWCWWW